MSGVDGDRALPPGPPHAPVWNKARWFFQPIPFMKACAKAYGDTFTLRMSGFPPFVFVSDPKHVKQAFAGGNDELAGGAFNQIFTSTVGKRSILTLEGADHLRHRRLLLPPLHGERVVESARAMVAITDEAVDRWPVGTPFPVYVSLQDVTLDVSLATIFGADRLHALADLRSTIFDFVGQGSGSPLQLMMLRFDGSVVGQSLFDRLGSRSPQAMLRAKLDRIDGLLYAEIRRRRGAGDHGAGILSSLLSATDEAGLPLTDLEIRDECVTMVIAAYETTAITLSYVLHELVRQPELVAKVKEEVEKSGDDLVASIPKLSLLEATINETMRLYPVVPVIGRVVLKKFALGPYEIPAGAVVAPCMYLTHRRPELWPDPDRFDPSRFLGRKINPYEFYPWGGGDRRCVGLNFAMYEMKLILALLLRRLAFAPAPAYRARLVRRGLSLALSEGLPLLVKSRSPRRHEAARPRVTTVNVGP